MLKQVSFVFLLFSFISFYSCTAKKAIKKDDVQVVKSNEEPKSEADKVEVVVFKDITPESKPPIKSPDPNTSGGAGSTSTKGNTSGGKAVPDKALNQEFNIAMVIPFSDQSSTKFLQYYSGAKIAAKELENEGSRLNITVIDANDPNYLASISQNTDLIIAPSEADQIKALAEYGKQKKTPVLSSLFSLSSISENPYFIQTRPSLKSHYSAMVADLQMEFKLEDAVIVGRQGKNEASWFEPFQVEGRKSKGMFEGKAFAELLLNEASISFASELSSGKKVFIFPNFSFKDEDFLLAALTKLKAEKGTKKIIVYAMSVLKDSDKFNKEIFESLNVRIPASKYIDNDKEEIKTFTNDFFMNFSDLPSLDAFEGADNMLFIGRALSRYGKTFPDQFYKLNEDYLHTSFDMRAVNKQNAISSIDFYENQHIKILSFNDGKFRP
jgi:hypothetical protein